MSRLTPPPAPFPLRRKVTDKHWRAIRAQMDGDTGGAIAMWAALLERNPHDAKALYFLALAFYGIHELEKATLYMRACVQEAPTHSDAWYNLGVFLRDAGRTREALEHFIAALEIDPRKVEALTNAGNLFQQLGDEESALGCWHMALAQDATRPEALYNRSFVRLLHGDYALGFEEYEARWKCPAFTSDYGRKLVRDVPRWLGESVDSGPLVLHGEQGAGDVLMMLRYVPLIAAYEVVLEVPRPMVTLVEAFFPDATVVARGDALPEFIAAQCPMMSLPWTFRTELETIPEPMPPEVLHRVPIVPLCECERLHVGLAWAGSKAHPNDADRSAPVDAFRPLLAIDGIHWTSLQVGERETEYADADMLRPSLASYLDTAAIINGLDMVVTVDTSVAHLAGMLGAEVHICTPSNPEWRWLTGRDTSPWYPSAHLWTRTRGRSWSDVVHALDEMLRARVRMSIDI